MDRLPLHPLEKGIFSIDSPPALGTFEEEGEGGNRSVGLVKLYVDRIC